MSDPHTDPHTPRGTPPSSSEEDRSSGRTLASPSRRRALARLSVALGSLAAAAVAVPWVGFLLSPILAPRREQWRAVGRVSGFSVGDTVEVTFRDAAAQPWSGASGDAAAWLRRDAQNRFTAFSIHCTHLGCPVRWEQGANLFMCPCHGGVFYADGSVAAGPPPRALTRFPVRVADGQVYVRTIGLPVT